MAWHDTITNFCFIQNIDPLPGLFQTNCMKLKLFSICLGLLMTFVANGQARLTVVNNSGRYMTVKVMQGVGAGALHETVFISAWGSATVYFSSSGTYFTKTKAVITQRDPVYKKGKAFRVTNDASGYSVLTLTFTIKESAVIQSTGQSISRAEFDRN